MIGAFNCQGGGWCPQTRRNKAASEFSHPLKCLTTPKDVEWSKGNNPISIEKTDIFAVYTFKEKKLRLLKLNDKMEVTLNSFDFELLTVSPVQVLGGKSVHFAPIGLVNMLNSGGAIDTLVFLDEEDVIMVKVGVKGVGDFKVFSSEKPRCCRVNGKDVKFSYKGCVVGIRVLLQDAFSRLSVVEYEF